MARSATWNVVSVVAEPFKKPRERQIHINVWYLVMALLLAQLIISGWQRSQSIETVPYSEFQLLLNSNQLQSVSVSSTHVRGKLRQPDDDGHEFIEAVRIEPDLAQDLAAHDVEFSGVIENPWIAAVLSWVLPALIFMGIWFYFIRRMSDRSALGGNLILSVVVASVPLMGAMLWIWGLIKEVTGLAGH